MRWAMFYLTEYANLIAFAAIVATLYFGGWAGPSFLPLRLVYDQSVLLHLLGDVDPLDASRVSAWTS